MERHPFDRLREKYPPGSTVSGKLLAEVAGGLLLEIEDGRGIVRWREVPDFGESDPVQVTRGLLAGSILDLVVIGADTLMQRLELSFVRSAADFARTPLERFHPGSECRGRVVHIGSQGALVELEPNVTAYLPRDEVPVVAFPRENADQLTNVLWVGDTVRALVSKADIDPITKKLEIELSLSDYIEYVRRVRVSGGREETQQTAGAWRPWHGMTAKLRPLLAMSGVGSEERSEEQFGAVEALRESGNRRVLLLDSDDRVLLALGTPLSLLGYSVETAQSADVASQLAEKVRFDFAFLDAETLSGGQLDAKRLVEELKADRVAIMGTPFSLMVDWPKTGIEVRQLAKPLKWQEIADVLGEGDRTVSITARILDLTSRLFDERQFHPRESVNQLLENLRLKLGANTCLLFSCEPTTRNRIDVVGQAGRKSDWSQEEVLHLRYSPVWDVLSSGAPVVDGNVTSNRGKYRYLLSALNFASFLGVPMSQSDGTKMALALFADRGNYFDEYHLTQAVIAGQILVLLEERKRFLSLIALSQGLASMGELGTVLLHEIRGWLLGIASNTASLNSYVRQLEAAMVNSDRRMIKNLIEEIKVEVSLLEDNDHALLSTAVQYLNLGGPEGPQEKINLHESIIRIVGLLDPLARRSHVEVRLSFSENLPVIQCRRSVLEQAFLNIMLNGIHQTYQYFPSGGELTIATQYLGTAWERPIQVRFIDTGPGIHADNVPKMFELGFTTKEGGTGIGLFVTQALLESSGARISLEDTAVLAGSTFLVELPEGLR